MRISVSVSILFCMEVLAMCLLTLFTCESVLNFVKDVLLVGLDQDMADFPLQCLCL